MKRRTLLTGGAIGIPVAAGSGRLFGAPTTQLPSQLPDTSNVLRLPLTMVGLPPQLLEITHVVANLWHAVLTRASEREAFITDPGRYLKDRGVPGDVLTAADAEVKTLLAMFHPDVRASVAAGDYLSYFQWLQRLGVLRSDPGGTLRSRIRTVMEADRQKFRDIFNHLRTLPEEDALALVRGDELQYVYSLLADSSKPKAWPPTADDDPETVVVVVLAVVQAVVVAAVDVQAVIISDTDVVATTESHVESEVGVSASGSEAIVAAGVPTSKARLAMADPELIVEGRRAQLIARLDATTSLPKANSAWLTFAEIDAVFAAARDAGLLVVPPEVHGRVVRAMTQAALRAANA